MDYRTDEFKALLAKIDKATDPKATPAQLLDVLKDLENMMDVDGLPKQKFLKEKK